MSYTVGDVTGRAQSVLHDSAGTRWPVSELIGWYNDAQRAIVTLRPDSNVVGAAVQLAQGVNQSLPAGGVTLIDIPFNTTAANAAPSRAVRRIDADVLSASRLAWPADTASATV